MKSFLTRWIDVLCGTPWETPSADTRIDVLLPDLKALCLRLVEDVTPSLRERMDGLISDANRPADFQHLREALYGTISLSFGDRVARERIAKLDALLVE